jgi:hypothetical protein
MGPSSTEGVRFYPVVHLFTGPPGLTRNGGIWKQLKAGLRQTINPPRLMVQAMHFASYTLSSVAWDEWNLERNGQSRIESELEETFGPNRDVFVDSGGFQLLHADKIDLSRWGLNVNPRDVLSLQLRFGASRLASLDSPLHPNASRADARRATGLSIRNAVFLASQSRQLDSAPLPYLVVHGRRPREIVGYLKRMRGALPAGWLRRARYGFALGSQVPLSSDPAVIQSNVQTVLRWMLANCPEDAPLHVFGVGDAVVRSLTHAGPLGREFSYDNSTYVQNAFRLKIYDPPSATYRAFSPLVPPSCLCNGCSMLSTLGTRFVTELMSAPAYCPSYHSGIRTNRSDVLAAVALHNLFWWEHRLTRAPPRSCPRSKPPATASASAEGYSFPVKNFRARAEVLLMVPCSRFRPYAKSPSHRRILAHLASEGFSEGVDFDRVTVSGLHGPVHWANESHPAVLGYDFAILPTTSAEHIEDLRYRTASVLNVIGKRYTRIVAYLRPRAYEATFGPVTQSFSGEIVRDIHGICGSLR